MKPNFIFLIFILLILVVVLVLATDFLAFDIPEPNLDFGLGAIGRELSKMIEGITRSIRF